MKHYIWPLQVRKNLRQTFCWLMETHVILGGSNNRLLNICSRGAVIVFYHLVQALQKARTEKGACREAMSTAGNQDLNSSKRYKWSTLLKSKTFRLRPVGEQIGNQHAREISPLHKINSNCKFRKINRH